MKKVVCLISSPPDSTQAQRGLELVQEWEKQGDKVQVCLIQDAVYMGLQKNTVQIHTSLSPDQWLVLDEDLQLRGFTSSELRPGVQTINYNQLTLTLLENADQVIGAF